MPLGLCCCGAVIPNSPPWFGPGPIGDNQTFTITHSGTGAGQTIITDIVVGKTTYLGDEITVSICDPCPVSVRAEKEYAAGAPVGGRKSHHPACSMVRWERRPPPRR